MVVTIGPLKTPDTSFPYSIIHNLSENLIAKDTYED